MSQTQGWMSTQVSGHITRRVGVGALLCSLALSGAVQAQGSPLGRPRPAATAAGGITSVEVFANSAMNVVAPTAEAPYLVKVYRVDGLALIEGDLKRNMPKDEKQAQAYFQANQAAIKKRYAPVATNAANGITRAIHYKLDRIPAVVINQRSVVYGVTNVEQAVTLYMDARETGRVK
ncbi:TIGR03757 family integrating conjugative element protein [Hydrogenophaga atypica]|uniref:TIGR03757 family integrating conjugative element protein n=1 Tax=Hydrogenophaga atypica TaxID=249409 RepID=A0ABW2QLP8_9BURK